MMSTERRLPKLVQAYLASDHGLGTDFTADDLRAYATPHASSPAVLAYYLGCLYKHRTVDLHMAGQEWQS
jgi:hypothetical protein